LDRILFWGWGDGDVGTDSLEARLGDAVNGAEVFDALEGAAFFAEADDGFGGIRPYARKLLKLLERGRVQVERFGGRLLLRLGCGTGDE
jgi:hypothetical protein